MTQDGSKNFATKNDLLSQRTLCRGASKLEKDSPVSDASVFTLAKHRGDPSQNPLLAFLMNVQDRPVEIQCDDITRMDAQNLQILLAAQKKWAGNNLDFQMTRMTAGAQQSLAFLGLEFSQFSNGDQI
jgi:hypothetical protein